MIAEEMKEYCYSFEDMQKILHDAQGRPMARATLLRKIHTDDPSVPPSIRQRRGVYFFPKEQYAEWIRKLPVETHAEQK